MSAVTTHGIGQTLAVLDVIRHRLSSFESFWPLLEARMPAIQANYWDRRFYRGFRHAPSTVEARLRGLGAPVREAKRRRSAAGPSADYYLTHRPTAGVSATHPFLAWTGSLRRATEAFTLKEQARAAIDAARNYQGPLKRELQDPVGALVESRVNPWDERQLERVTDAMLEEWALREAQEAAMVT